MNCDRSQTDKCMKKHQTLTWEATTNYKVFGACILLALNPNRLKHGTWLNGPKDVVTKPWPMTDSRFRVILTISFDYDEFFMRLVHCKSYLLSFMYTWRTSIIESICVLGDDFSIGWCGRKRWTRPQLGLCLCLDMVSLASLRSLHASPHVLHNPLLYS
jgi:hypothetical protein